MATGLHIRQARVEDYEEIMAIEVYEGLDYLPAMFYYFMQHPKYYVVVGEENGKVVAMANMRLCPEDNTAIGFSARCIPSLAGSSGLRTSGESPWKTFLLKQDPNIEKFTAVSVMIPQHSDGTYTIHDQRIQQLYMSSVAELQARLSTYQPTYQQSLLDISYSDVEQILLRTDKIQMLFKKYAKDYVIGQWHLRPMKIDNQTEMKELFATSSKTFITLASASGRKFEAANWPDVANLLLEPDNIITSLSFSVALPIKLGLRFDIRFYGPNPECFEDHVRAQVSHVTKVYTGSVAFILQFPILETIKPGDVEDRVRPLLGNSVNGEGSRGTMWSRKLIVPSKM